MVRKIALDCLKEILMKQGYSNLVLKGLPKELETKDVALITQIVYGTLQHYDFLSYQWYHFVERKVKKEVELVLNMSCFQLIFLDRIPDYAIVSEACKLVKPELRKFVQAILMKCIGQGKKEVTNLNELETIQIETSIPLWILSMWKAHYGIEAAVDSARALQSQDYELVARINPLKITKDALLKDERIHFIDDWACSFKGNLLESDYFKEGKIIIQDYSSQQVVKILAPRAQERILDACSAPGSKTSMMAAMMNNQGSIIACDLHQHRLQLMKHGLDLWGISNATLIKQDMTEAHTRFEKESFDRILLDVPCSGLGVIKRKPDLKFRIKPEDIDALVLVQEAILDSCQALLKPGGVLVYSTCTLNKKENDKQVEHFVKKHPHFKVETQQTYFPYENKQDGFYIAKLVKHKENTDENLI